MIAASQGHAVVSSLLSSLFWIVLFFVWNRLRKKMMRKISRVEQGDARSPEVYAVIVKGLRVPFSQEELEEHMHVYYQCEVQKTDIIYNLEEVI